MKNDPPPKREKRKLPPEKLYEVLRGIFYEELANEVFEKLTATSHTRRDSSKTEVSTNR